MNWTQLSPENARRRYRELADSEKFTPAEMTREYEDIRGKLMNVISDFSQWQKGAGAYDIETGLAVYQVLNSCGLDLRNAANEGVWRHLSLNILPDRVEERWPDRPEERFFSGRSRIWLRNLWWFTHLTWQGTEAATRAVLKRTTADDIAQLLERPGRQGFRIELCRALFRARTTRVSTQAQFRAIMVLNTARLVMVEPELHEGGLEGYVGTLYATIEAAKLPSPTGNS